MQHPTTQTKLQINTSSCIRVGCAGWALRKEYAGEFPSVGTHLSRYAGRFPTVEINSSFYKSHQPSTYAKWADSVPDDFRFSVKMPKEITHIRRLSGSEDVLDRFLSEVALLGEKLGPLLIQLPPSLGFDSGISEAFFATLRDRFDRDVAVEPRHASWFDRKADRLMTKYRVTCVAADPAVVEKAAAPGGWNGMIYYRLHGSPRMYYSAYDDAYLDALAVKLLEAAKSAKVWCIFDNTAAGAALTNALSVRDRFK